MKAKMLSAKKNSGFTLVELIIVIAIIAILTAVAAPQYIKYVDKARWSKDQNVAASVLTTIEAAVIDVNSDENTGNDVKGTDAADVTVTFTDDGITAGDATLQGALKDAFGGTWAGDGTSKVNNVVVVTNTHKYQADKSTTYTVSIDKTGTVKGEWTA